MSSEKRNGESETGCWALVTGGSRGIGRAVAIELAARGWNLIVAYLRNDSAADAVKTAVQQHGRQILLHKMNVAKQQERAELMDLISRDVGTLSGFVHCAALGGFSPALETRPNKWQLAWDTHVAAFVELVGCARSVFTSPANVVAVSSLGAQRVMTGYASIGAVKGALEVLVRYLGAELARDGINVNAVCGGPIDTDSLRSAPDYAQLEDESRRRPSARMGVPEDIAPVIAFLMSQDANWIRGQVIVVDGGFSLY